MTDTKNATTIKNRKDFLKKVDSTVNQDRNTSYGDVEDSFNTIATMWNAYLANKGSSVKLGALDVAAMMTLLKVARLSFSSEHYDSWIDIAGYAACGGGLAGYMDKSNDDNQINYAPVDYKRDIIKVDEYGYAYEYLDYTNLPDYVADKLNAGMCVFASSKAEEITYHSSEKDMVGDKNADYIYSIKSYEGKIIKTYYTDKQVADRRFMYRNPTINK